MIIDSPIISGSSAASGSLNQFGNVAITGSLTVTGAIIGAVTGSVDSASYASNAELLDGRDSTTFTSTSSFQNYTSSNDAQVLQLNNVSASLNSYTSSNNANIAALNAATASLYNATSSIYLATASLNLATASIYGATSSLFAYTSSNSANVATLFATSASLNAAVADIRNATASLYAATASLYNATASIYGATSSLFNYSASSNLRINALDQYTASLNIRSASFACIDSTNNFACVQYFSNASNAVSFTSTGSLYSDGGIRITKDMYVSGTAFFNNVTVFGTQSVNYITSSQLNISSNIISVNTATPTVRFGGLAVYDSGSLGTGLTGSLLWDSEDNQWIYSNPSGSTYDSALFLVGPRNSGALGGEAGITCNFLSKGNGMHHMTSSGIFENGTTTCFYGNASITSAGAACFANQICAQGATFTTTGNTAVTIAAGATGLSRLVFQGPVANSRGFIDYDNSTCGFIVRANESTALTISNVGAAVFSNALQVAGQQAASNYGGTGLNFDFTSGNVGRIASVKTTSGGSSLELHTYNTSGADVTALTINSNGIACFACQICAPVSVVTGASIVSGCLGVGTGTPRTKAEFSSGLPTSIPTHTNTTNGIVVTDGGDIYGRIGVSNFSAGGNGYPTYIQAGDYSGAIYYNLLLNPLGGNVGIGTTSPANKLDVNGTLSTSLIVPYGTTYKTSNFLDFYPGNDNVLFFHAGTSWGDPLIAVNGTTAGSVLTNSLAQQLVIRGDGANGIGFSNGSSINMIIKGSCVGIGTVSPVRKLDIVSTGEQLRLAYDASGTVYSDFRNDSAGGLLVNTSGPYIINYIGGSAKMRIDASATCFSTPVCSSGIVSSGCITGVGESTYIGTDAQAVPRLGFMKKSGAQPFLVYAQDPFVLASSSGPTINPDCAFTSRLSITTTGIATFACQVCAPRLEILRSSANNGLFVYSNSGATPIGCTMAQINGLTNDSTGNILTLGSLNDGIRMVVRNDGNVGIGTSTPAFRLHVHNTSGPSVVVNSVYNCVCSVWNSSDGSIVFFGAITNHPLQLITNDVTRLTITSAGAVSIRATCIGLSDIADRTLLLGSRPGNADIVSFGFDVGGTWKAGFDFKGSDGQLEWWTNNGSWCRRIMYTPTGIACFSNTICTGGHILPTSNGTQDLGSSSLRWCTVYTSDLSLNNGIGNYTIVEGENDLFLYNNNSCKVYKFIVQEVCPEIAPAKRSI